MASALPATAAIGALTTHVYGVITLSALAPVSSATVPGRLENMNARSLAQPLPDRFILGDGGGTRAFVGVDKRPGTPLARALDDLVARIVRRVGAPPSLDALLEHLRTGLHAVLAPTPGAASNFAGAELPWDKGVALGPNAQRAFATVFQHTPKDLPIATDEQYPVVPFERWLQLGQGYCLQRALLASFILERFGVRHRLVQGATVSGMTTFGHTWIELEGGRVLDPSWRLLGPKGPRDPSFPELFLFGGTHRFASERYLYLVL